MWDLFPTAGYICEAASGGMGHLCGSRRGAIGVGVGGVQLWAIGVGGGRGTASRGAFPGSRAVQPFCGERRVLMLVIALCISLYDDETKSCGIISTRARASGRKGSQATTAVAPA